MSPKQDQNFLISLPISFILTIPRSLSLVTTLISNAAVIKAAFEAWKESVPSLKEVPNIVFALVLEPLPPAIYSRHADTNSLGLGNRKDALIVTLISVTWFTSEDDDLIHQSAQGLLDSINSAADRLGCRDPYIYLNYAGKNQDPIASYGSDSIEHLLQVRDRVDPTLVFTKQVPGGYKLPRF